MTIYQEQLQKLLHASPTKQDIKRLSPHLSGWSRLNEILLLDSFTREDLKLLIVIEVRGRKRRQMIDKLVSRLKSAERDELKKLIEQCLSV